MDICIFYGLGADGASRSVIVIGPSEGLTGFQFLRPRHIFGFSLLDLSLSEPIQVVTKMATSLSSYNYNRVTWEDSVKKQKLG